MKKQIIALSLLTPLAACLTVRGMDVSVVVAKDQLPLPLRELLQQAKQQLAEFEGRLLEKYIALKPFFASILYAFAQKTLTEDYCRAQLAKFIVDGETRKLLGAWLDSAEADALYLYGIELNSKESCGKISPAETSLLGAIVALGNSSRSDRFQALYTKGRKGGGLSPDELVGEQKRLEAVFLYLAKQTREMADKK